MYKGDPVTHSQLADNQRNGNSVPLSLPGESMTIGNYVANMEHKSECMITKDNSNF